MLTAKQQKGMYQKDKGCTDTQILRENTDNRHYKSPSVQTEASLFFE